MYQHTLPKSIVLIWIQRGVCALDALVFEVAPTSWARCRPTLCRGPRIGKSLPKLDRRTQIVHALEVSETSCARKLRDRRPSPFNAFEIPSTASTVSCLGTSSPNTPAIHPSPDQARAPQSTVRLRSCHDQCAYSMAPGSGAYCHVLATQHPVETARIRESASLDSLRFHVATTIWQDLLFELYCYTKPRSWQKLI